MTESKCRTLTELEFPAFESKYCGSGEHEKLVVRPTMDKQLYFYTLPLDENGEEIQLQKAIDAFKYEQQEFFLRSDELDLFITWLLKVRTFYDSK